MQNLEHGGSGFVPVAHSIQTIPAGPVRETKVFSENLTIQGEGMASDRTTSCNAATRYNAISRRAMRCGACPTEGHHVYSLFQLRKSLCVPFPSTSVTQQPLRPSHRLCWLQVGVSCRSSVLLARPQQQSAAGDTWHQNIDFMVGTRHYHRNQLRHVVSQLLHFASEPQPRISRHLIVPTATQKTHIVHTPL